MHEHFDAVDRCCLGAEYAAERLATEIRVDFGEEHIIGRFVVAYDESVLVTEYVLLGDLDGLRLLLLLVDKVIISQACMHVHSYF